MTSAPLVQARWRTQDRVPPSPLLPSSRHICSTLLPLTSFASPCTDASALQSAQLDDGQLRTSGRRISWSGVDLDSLGGACGCRKASLEDSWYDSYYSIFIYSSSLHHSELDARCLRASSRLAIFIFISSI
ncbi:hypothetical protein BDV98DRAFT_194797 [Pterulicium gracile]|uniref:Uncharacterized protein n=1 Tax=Pterulicium gracile TaxID=1884261 RepID=A0A5C3QB53_9AGAR|nr:hypothetical protein BDV98DRAFT_194797 [Pterula gracilis]